MGSTDWHVTLFNIRLQTLQRFVCPQDMLRSREMTAEQIDWRVKAAVNSGVRQERPEVLRSPRQNLPAWTKAD